MRGAYHSDSVGVWCGRDSYLVQEGGVSGEREGGGDGSFHIMERGPR